MADTPYLIIAIASIDVPPRLRGGSDIMDLAASIKTHGQLQPIVVSKRNERYELIAGERRLRSCDFLGLQYVHAQIREEMSDAQREILEIVENVDRLELTGAEKVIWRGRLHELLTGSAEVKSTRGRAPKEWKIAEDGTPVEVELHRHTAEDTAAMMNISPTRAKESIAIYRKLNLLPEDMRNQVIADNPTEDGLRRAVDRVLDRAEQRFNTQQIIASEASSPTLLSEDREVKHGDALTLLRSLPEKCIDLVITDPPYGDIEDSMLQRKDEGVEMSWKDDASTTLDLLRSVIPELYRVMRDQSHMYMFGSVGFHAGFDCDPCSYPNFFSIGRMLLSAGFKVRAMPIIWYKRGKQGFKAGGQLWPYTYEGCIFAYKGKQEGWTQPEGDVIPVTPVHGQHKIHKTQKPRGLASVQINASGPDGGMLLDPFCGSGTFLVDGIYARMRVLGFDSDMQNVFNARQRIEDAREDIAGHHPPEKGLPDGT